MYNSSMHFKQAAIAIIVLIILAAGFGLWASKATAPGPSGQEQSILMGSATPQGDYKHTEEAPYYTIETRYPAGRPVVEAALAASIAQFKEDGNFANLTAEDIQIQGLGPDRKYAYDAEYKTYNAPGYTSYFYTIYQDTLGAHPNGFFLTFVFDKEGKQVALADLFMPGARYLDRLSAEAQKQVLAELAKRADAPATPDTADTVRIGTSPSPEALQFFYLDGDTLVLAFPPYQVAAYAMGSFEARIPLADLKDILK